MAQKKIADFGLNERKLLIDEETSCFSKRTQCRLLGINWSTMYYKPAEISSRDLEMMNILDCQFTKTPFYGVLKMTEILRSKQFIVGKDHVRTLLRKMGLKAVYAKPNLSKPHPENKIYPYLLKDVTIENPNHVWSADITYIRMMQGFAYLMVIIDWYSRYVLSWRLSNTLDSSFCVEALKEALNKYGNPGIFNSDQGVQFTSNDFINTLKEQGVSISMDGKGRAFDNIFVERLWRSVKYENIYMNGYQNIPETKKGLNQYFEFYNNERFHQSLDYKTPSLIYSGGYRIITECNKIDSKSNVKAF